MLLERNGKSISHIEFNKKDVTIYFGLDKLVISKLAYDSMNLFIGKTISIEDIESLNRLTTYSKHLSYCYNLLSKKRYSEAKIKEKLLMRKVNEEDINSIINKLKNSNLINDDELIRDIIRLGNEKNYGKYKIITNLKNNGLVMPLLKEYFLHEDEVEKAKRQIIRLEDKYSKESYLHKMNHIHKSLSMLGFEVNVINEAMANIKEIDVENEFSNLEGEFKKAILRLENEKDDKLLKQKLIKHLMGKGYQYNDINILWEEYINEINSRVN